MNANRIWAIVTVLVIAAVLGLGWVLGVSPLLAQASLADAERETVEQTNAAESARLEQMRQIDENVEELEDELYELRISIPTEVDTDLAYRLFADIQDATGAQLKTIVTTNAVVYGSQVDGSAGVPQPEPAPSETPAPSASPAPGAVAPPVVGAPAALHTVAFTFTFEAKPVETVMAFAEGLQASPRLFLVTDVVADAASTSTITGYMFVMSDPDSPRSAAASALAGLPLGGTRVKSGAQDPAPTESEQAEDGATPSPTGSPTPTP